MSSVIDRISRRYPRLAFQVLATDTTTAFRALVKREVDLLVAHIIEPIANEHINAEVLFHDPHT